MRDTQEIAVRMLTASIIIGPLVLIGALPAAADQPPVALGSGAPVQLAAAGDASADRDTYIHQAQDEMQEWQRKLHDFSATAEAKGKEAGTAAETHLNDAWAKAEDASRQLQTVSAEGWESAKTAYENASRDLSDAWNKVHPE